MRRFVVLVAMLVGCGGVDPIDPVGVTATVDGNWAAEHGGAYLHLEGGAYVAYFAPTPPAPRCQETGAYHLVGGTQGAFGEAGSDLVLEVGAECLPSRALFWRDGDELWQRSGDIFAFRYLRSHEK